MYGTVFMYSLYSMCLLGPWSLFAGMGLEWLQWNIAKRKQEFEPLIHQLRPLETTRPLELVPAQLRV